VWRRWTHYIGQLGLADDPSLASLPSHESELVTRSFLSFYREAEFKTSGGPKGKRVKPMVCSTIRDAASSLAAALRNNLGTSPFHIQRTTVLLPSIRKLLKAFASMDPPPHRQKAVTPKFLRQLFATSGAGLQSLCDTAPAVCADLVIAAWFFAMRGCEFTQVPTPGKTLPVRFCDVTFRDKQKRQVHNTSPRTFLAEYVTITFRDQKNGRKLEARTMRRTGEHVLCPILRWASIIDRLLRHKFKPTTEVFCFGPPSTRRHSITIKHLADTLKATCTVLGGQDEFGFGPDDIGAKSIRSGAAMALFLSDVSIPKIMILGRWVSDAFMDYIRPQVLEWTSELSLNMTSVGHFTDLNGTTSALSSDPQSRCQSTDINGATFLTPKFHLHH
jgi:hypothetical protein